MVADIIDYRISRIVVLCKDCGHDVGLYPARHKCGVSDADALLPFSISKQHLSIDKTNNNGSTSSSTQNDNSNNGEGLWGKLRSVRNWKEVPAEGTIDIEALSQPQPSQGAKLWDKLLSATRLNDASGDDSDNESEKDDWEGETHISRILREYYQEKSGDLPDWLFDSKSIILDKSPIINNFSYKSKSFHETYDRAHSDNNSGGRQMGFNNTNELSASPISLQSPLSVLGMERGRTSNRYGQANIGPSSDGDSGGYSDRNSNKLYPSPIPQQGYRPSNLRSASDDSRRMLHKKSQQKLQASSEGHYYNESYTSSNRTRSVSPVPPYRAFTTRDNGFKYSQENNGHSQQGISSRGKANRQGGFF